MAWCQTLKAQGDTPEEENKTGDVAIPGRYDQHQFRLVPEPLSINIYD